MDLIIGRFLKPFNSSRTMGSVRAGVDSILTSAYWFRGAATGGSPAAT
jgi:hypothetical protein